MARRDGEFTTYFFVAGLFTAIGVILLVVGIWLYLPEYSLEGYASIIFGVVFLFFGLALLLAGVSRKLDERRKRTSEARRASRKRWKKRRR